MLENVIVFTGSKKDFTKLLSNRISSEDITANFMEIIQEYNLRISRGRPKNNSSASEDNALSNRIIVDNCIVRTDDFGSVLGHVVSNFANIISLNYDITNLYIQNPPKRVLQSLETLSDVNFEYVHSNYKHIDRLTLKELYNKLCTDILGQEDGKKQIVGNIYKLTSRRSDKPVVIMLYGKSGVGKTETAKAISEALGGNLLRIQFSMMQSNEAYDYIFGGEHSKSSFARDMIARESNVILIDEFDKVNTRFYNAFYELFDEGRYVDTNYEVDLKEAIFICTSNFMSENEIKRALGLAMFSRIGCCIKYEDISIENKKQIIKQTYNDILSTIQDDEKSIIAESDILSWFLDNVSRYDNIRIMKTKLENAIFEKLTNYFIIGEAK